ncbi:SDR family NAD(P)-dependent oxidoreductase [Pseudomonas marginalis]|uniref:SDR family NAD(P)-dependent oxidoreductase n=1 Tax=Pseudomonas TaxID=286 RepID=UPI00389AEC8D
MNSDRLQRLFGLDGKVAVVTDSGANSSAEVALLLAEAGATVVLADNDEATVQATVQNIRDAGGQASGFNVDVESEASVLALFDQVRSTFGDLDILVNCAAINANRPLHEFPLSLWDEVQSVNLRSVFLCMREGIKQMVVGGHGGRIVNITTMGARHPVLHGNAAYAASRAGVSGLVRSAALDYAAHSILINEVLPGAIPGKVRFHSDNQAALLAGSTFTGPASDALRLPLGYGRAEDIAAAVLYLVGPSATYMTGQSIVLDGGFLLT